MPGRIDAYVDTVSPYSWYASSYLVSQRRVLESHGIALEFHPFFLGAVQVKTGNVPPFQIPAKARYGEFDGPKAAAHFGLSYRGAPDFFPMRSLAPQRALTVIKEMYSQEVFERILLLMFEAVWKDWKNLADLEILQDTLAQIFFKVDVGGGWKHTTAREVGKVMKKIQEVDTKEKLNAVTGKALELGAFGAPFMSVKKWDDGQKEDDVKGEPFFGSDRFEYMFDYLGLPLQKMRILEKDEVESRAKL